jgi:hypothetical protein
MPKVLSLHSRNEILLNRNLSEGDGVDTEGKAFRRCEATAL